MYVLANNGSDFTIWVLVLVEDTSPTPDPEHSQQSLRCMECIPVPTVDGELKRARMYEPYPEGRTEPIVTPGA